MTEAEIETAARKLCQLRGVDPDSHFIPVGPDFISIRSEHPNWVYASDEIRSHARINEAIAFTMMETAWVQPGEGR